MRWVLFAFACGACSFSTHQVAQNGGGSNDGSVDAPPDGLPATCAPNDTACDGRVRKVCGADGHWDNTLDTTCDFTCSAGACVVASNVSLSDVAGCGSGAPALAPPAGATVTLSASGGDHIDCTPDCGNGVTRIDRIAVANNLAWFCLASIDLPGDVTLGVPASGGPAEAIAFIVDGAVSIAGQINFDGGSATRASTGGVGAPGGFDGSDLTSSDSANGHGPCAGQGGHHSGSSDHWTGGGGGGGGLLSAGGGGGGGECTHSDHTTTGGNASGAGCGTPELIPLVGGSGGGAGGDATVNVQQGWAGGGGGGSLQISSRVAISITGAIHARGGDGYGEMSVDGGGGGGAGGAILLEAPSLTLAGMLIVDGGSGGSSGSGPGGMGATGANAAGVGDSYAQAGQGGSGGGGGAGRIRLNAGNPSCGGGVSPAGSCTTGVLVAQ
jgi:hypothetical protein